MTVFAGRTGKDEFKRVAAILDDLELTEHVDACIGTLALTALAFAKRGTRDEVFRLQLLVNVIGGRDQ